ncbi:MAG: hypothetical protein KBT48_00215 [Firmicutes bacterium]|nr:hypothetical protein [Bacillota bacterium]
MEYIEYRNLDLVWKKSEEYHRSCLNAMAIVEDLSWKEAYGRYIQTLHTYCSTPDHKKNIKKMLKLFGYQKVRYTKDFEGKAIVLMNNLYFAIEKRDDDLVIYVRNPKSVDGTPTDLIKEGTAILVPVGNSERVKEKTKFTSLKKDTYTMRYENKNPLGKNVGDCAIRAIASTMNIGWHESLDALAKVAYEHHCIFVNTSIVLDSYLSRQGFLQIPAHKKMNGSDLCEKLDHKFAGEVRLFAYSGKSHVISIVKEKEDRFKIVDTWDSSKRTIQSYFIRY